MGLKRRKRERRWVDPRLSAEPLVGLKLGDRAVPRDRAILSAEPLVGLKQPVCPAITKTPPLSAEPLVGLKP